MCVKHGSTVVGLRDMITKINGLRPVNRVTELQGQASLRFKDAMRGIAK